MSGRFAAPIVAAPTRAVDEEWPRSEAAVSRAQAAPTRLPTIYRSLSTRGAPPVQVSVPDEPQEREADKVSEKLTTGSERTASAADPPPSGARRTAVTSHSASLHADPTPVAAVVRCRRPHWRGPSHASAPASTT